MARKSKAVVPSVAEFIEANYSEAEAVRDEEITGEYLDDLDENGNIIPLDEDDEEDEGGLNPPSMLMDSLGQIAQSIEQEAKPEATETKADKNQGVGLFIKKRIAEGLGNKAILDMVHEAFGNKHTTYACVAWYRNKMKKEGLVVKTTASLEWLQDFAKANGLSEEAVQELTAKVA